MNLSDDPNVSRAESEKHNNYYSVIRVQVRLNIEKRVPRFAKNRSHYFHWLS
jgi:hypothetical protein